MVVEIFEVVVGGFRWFYVVSCFSTYPLSRYSILMKVNYPLLK